MGINNEIAKASIIMGSYGIPKEDQIRVVTILLDAGVEKCLDEQQKIRDEADSITRKAFHGLVH